MMLPIQLRFSSGVYPEGVSPEGVSPEVESPQKRPWTHAVTAL